MSGPFPEGSAERKEYPVHSIVAGYFPAAIAAVAHHSYLGNLKHNPGESLHWARGKSDDHHEAAMRHLIEGDLVGAAWRVLAALQLQREAEGSPVAPLAKYAAKPFPMPTDVEVVFEADPKLQALIERTDEDAPLEHLLAGKATPPESDGHPLSNLEGEATFNGPLNLPRVDEGS